MKILIVGNYPGDGLRSMERFERMMVDGINHKERKEHIEVQLIRSAVVFGRFFQGTPFGKWLGYLDKFVLFWFVLRLAIAKRPGWVVHILDQGNGIWAGWAPGCVITCHDLLAIRAARGEFPGVTVRSTGRIFQRLILAGLRNAGTLVSVSEATRQDAERLTGRKSKVIANGLDEFWKPVDTPWDLVEQAGVPADARETGYVLHVGGDQWYKNRAAVLRAFRQLREREIRKPRLVLVGPEVRETEGVTCLDRVTDETLRALYSAARVFLFPSMEEGFGWPILEAQACGCPVVTLAAEPMRGTAGGAAICASEEGLADALVEAFGMDTARRTELIAAGRENARRFSTEKMAREYLEVYQRACAARSSI